MQESYTTTSIECPQNLEALRKAADRYNTAIKAIPGGKEYTIEGVQLDRYDDLLKADRLGRALKDSYAGKDLSRLVLDMGHQPSPFGAKQCNAIPALDVPVKALTAAIEKAAAAADQQYKIIQAGGNDTPNATRLQTIEGALWNDLKALPKVRSGECGSVVGFLPR